MILNFEGDRKINNYISKNLKKYKNKKKMQKIMTLNNYFKYIKNITNKDNSGNPKNYNIKVTKVNINFSQMVKMKK